MKKIKKWLRNKLIELLGSDIEDIVSRINGINSKCEPGLCNELEYRNEIKFSELVGHKVEIRHYTQDESIFVNVDAVMESSTYIKSKESRETVCKSKGIILIDMDKTVYTLADIYEYEIRKREVLDR